MSDDSDSSVAAFIERWSASGAAERANFQPFLSELCDLIGVERPQPSTEVRAENTYAFERSVQFAEDPDRERGQIDCYRKGAFVMEAKQGSGQVEPSEKEVLTGERLKRKMGTARRGTPGWEQAMLAAKRQARRYAKALPEEDGWPPFLVVVDVGHCIDLYADFARQGKSYLQFPGPQSYRIELEDLRSEEVRERLRQLWENPMALDPSRRSARVTRDLAEKLGRLASALEGKGHDPDETAGFLMRSLFTMFAEDAGLIPEESFTGLLEDYQADDLEMLPQALSHLWETMDEGGFSPALRTEVRQFNGAIFSDSKALPLSEAQRELLAEAARADWSEVEPAIFGTLLERALDPRERHRLGAHYTPRAYVERLVQPTVVEPLREEWEATQAAAASLDADGEQGAAIEELRGFHKRLCRTKVLDPACGSGNFLYVTLEHLKRLEGEVLQALGSYGASAGLEMTGGNRVSPEQLLGLELNPRAARIADVVLWIGYLQWHLRTHGSADRLDEPILKAYGNIEERDALITYEAKRERTDEEGEPITRWDRRTMKKHPTTGEMVPDESATEPVYNYIEPEMADWPEADFIVGNPPFIGNKFMRRALGEGYTDALREAYYRRVSKSADFVMFWWYKAAGLVRKERPERFGFITTNSIRQTFNRRVMEKQMGYKNAVYLAFAIPDHPWVASKTGADVRISMTVGMGEEITGTLQTVTQEDEAEGIHRRVELSEKRGTILPDLTIGADVSGTEALEANDGMGHRGVTLVGRGFVVEPEEATEFGLGEIKELDQHIRPYRNGRDLAQTPRGVKVIDLYGLEKEEVRDRFPAVYQHILETVKPERDENNRASYRENWWIHGEPRSEMRDAFQGLKRFIATPYVSKHRFFQFLDASILPDEKLVNVASDDAFHLGVLSSRIHTIWSLAAGSRHVDRPVYNKTSCFDPFPFPAASESEQETIREVAESLDQHRKERLAKHDGLTMTGLYNVFQKVRAGDTLTESERQTYEQGLVGVLKELHDELDAAVARSYGWEAGLGEEEILYRLVDLNKARRAEEKQGRIRYLRPRYQAPEATQSEMEIEIDEPSGDGAATTQPQPMPDSLPERMRVVRQVVEASGEPMTVEDVASRFHYARRSAVRELLDTLVAVGQAEEPEDGRYVG